MAPCDTHKIPDRLETNIERGDSRVQYSFPTYTIFCVSHRVINNICFIIYIHPYFSSLPEICNTKISSGKIHNNISFMNERPVSSLIHFYGAQLM